MIMFLEFNNALNEDQRLLIELTGSILVGAEKPIDYSGGIITEKLKNFLTEKENANLSRYTYIITAQEKILVIKCPFDILSRNVRDGAGVVKIFQLEKENEIMITLGNNKSGTTYKI